MVGIGTGLAALNLGARVAGASGFLKRVPRWVWIALGAIALLVAGYVYHQHKAHAAIAGAKLEQKAADDTAWQKRLGQAHAAALAWRGRAEQQGATIARLNKEMHDAQIRDHAAVADALSLRGPGAAASHCRPVDHSAAASVAGGRSEAAAGADAAGRAVPSGEWAVVPWDWLVTRAREHDDLLTDETTRRAADKQQREAWEKMRTAPPK
jgi:hypothetical protein